MENRLVLCIGYHGHGPGHLESLLRHLAGHQIGLVNSCYRRQDVGTTDTGRFQDPLVGTVPAKHNAAQLIVKKLAPGVALFDHQHFMPSGK